MNQPSTGSAPIAGLLTYEQAMHWRISWLSTVDPTSGIGILYMLAGYVLLRGGRRRKPHPIRAATGCAEQYASCIPDHVLTSFSRCMSKTDDDLFRRDATAFIL